MLLLLLLSLELLQLRPQVVQCCHLRRRARRRLARVTGAARRHHRLAA